MTENQILNYHQQQAALHTSRANIHQKIVVLLLELHSLRLDAVTDGIDITAAAPVIISSETPIFTTKAVNLTESSTNNWGKKSALKNRREKDIAREMSADPPQEPPLPALPEGIPQLTAMLMKDVVSDAEYYNAEMAKVQQKQADEDALKASDHALREKVEQLNEEASEQKRSKVKWNDPFPARMPVLLNPKPKPEFDPSIINVELKSEKSKTKISRKIYDNLIANTPGQGAKKMLANKWKGRILD